jgi:hypothetical protein
MSFILEDCDDYEIYFSHQCDARTFNRGATKNIGFLAIKEKYPKHYQNMTFVFNDIDTIPFNKIFDYQTTHGVVKHYYGYKHALGGIVVIKGADFEKINGFPCFWGWGMEDNVLQKRCQKENIYVDRSVFYKIGSPEILQLFDGISRIISKKDPWRMDKDNGVDGINTIHKLQYTIDSSSKNNQDNIFTIHNPHMFVINISTFLTYVRFENDNYYNYDLREPKRAIINPNKLRETRQTVVTTDNWTNIPYYPTTLERKEDLVNKLIESSKPIPPQLIQEIKEMKKKEIHNDAYNNFKQNTIHHTPNHPHNPHNHHNHYTPSHTPNHTPSHTPSHTPPPTPPNEDESINETINDNITLQNTIKNTVTHMVNNMTNHALKTRTIHHNTSHVPNKFSPQYAQYIGQQPRAQTSARIRLGGVF